MDIETLVKHLENKLVMIDANRKVVFEKGNMELYETFTKEYMETQVLLYQVTKAAQDINFYKARDVRDKLKFYLLETVPSLALYFKTESINKVIGDALEQAFDKTIKELFEDKIVNIV